MYIHYTMFVCTCRNTRYPILVSALTWHYILISNYISCYCVTFTSSETRVERTERNGGGFNTRCEWDEGFWWFNKENRLINSNTCFDFHSIIRIICIIIWFRQLNAITLIQLLIQYNMYVRNVTLPSGIYWVISQADMILNIM